MKNKTEIRMNFVFIGKLNLSKRIKAMSIKIMLRPKESTNLSKEVNILDFPKIAKSKKYPGIKSITAMEI